MSSDIADKIRSLGHLRHKGQTRTKTIVDENTGRPAGRVREHWNDRQDAVAMPDAARLKIKLTEEDE